MKRLTYLSLSLLVLAFASVHAQETTQEFVEKAAISNKFEIGSSKLAAERAQSEAVRAFARHMIEDHEKAGNKLHEVVEESGTQVSVPESLDKKHADMMQELGETGAEEFDRKYVEMQAKTHEEAVRLFESFAENGGNEGAIRKFAENTLPKLRDHKQKIEEIRTREGS